MTYKNILQKGAFATLLAGALVVFRATMTMYPPF